MASVRVVTLLVSMMECPTEQPKGEEVYLGVQGHTKGSVPHGAEVRAEQLPARRWGSRGKDAWERVKAGYGFRPRSFHPLAAPDNATRV